MARKKYHNNRERFLEVAETRTKSVLDRLRILGHCANKNLYDYKPEEIEKIFKTIQSRVNETKKKFDIDGKDEFKLP